MLREMTEEEAAIAIELLQRSLHAERGRKFDVYYRAGKGALVVEHGADLTPANVVLAVPEVHLYVYATVGILA
ncbi:hypothetical protein D3C81_1110540 [compost metagenome]